MSRNEGPPPKAVLVLGAGDVGSAVAHLLFRAGLRVALLDGPAPAAPRRGMAFVDAAYVGEATLDGVPARRLGSLAELAPALADRGFVPLLLAPLSEALAAHPWDALVDARLRKRSVPEPQRGLAPLTIGLGPNFVAGETVDIAVETSWERLGEIVRAGPTLPLAGEPRSIGGLGRERFVYAQAAGVFRTTAAIGQPVRAGELVATVAGRPVIAPADGVLRGLSHDGARVTAGAKVVEVDPRGDPRSVHGIGERPRRVAEAVLSILTEGSEERYSSRR